ncbi:2-deoxyribose-5-phosphate aldolase [Corynebacterium freneyi]|uniref:2-deoxyribose-5-phosphate aldolase n=1 Tax=Corynebacterium freneyi TaxID=134034 RepID=UPI0012EBAE66|nr:2-deoxyribose-5-phosphate aldolase [Corynebacterium freneyi]
MSHPFAVQNAAKTDVAIFDPELPADGVRAAVEAAAEAGCAGVRLLPAMMGALGGADAGRLRVGVVCGFPTGRSHILVKAAEARLAAEHGAHDVAVVLDRSAVAAGDVNAVLSEVVALRGAVAAPTQLTVVVEAGLHASGVLDDDAFDRIIGAIAAGGADAIATGTGWGTVGAAAGEAGPEQILRIRAAAPGVGVIAVIGEEMADDARDPGRRAGEALAAGAHVVQVPGPLPDSV